MTPIKAPITEEALRRGGATVFTVLTHPQHGSVTYSCGRTRGKPGSGPNAGLAHAKAAHVERDFRALVKFASCLILPHGASGPIRLRGTGSFCRACSDVSAAVI